ncbi:uncharacterized protein [Amphiura filiformis]|uniref:uncharacterized protein n=1 Tax=Amphiura filiformis TaxID=82378 RepID=UPI003B217154
MEATKHGTGQLLTRNEQLVKENDALKEQSTTMSHTAQNTLQKEVNDILEKRAYQDEQVRVQDIEINKLKSVKTDLEQELRDTRNFMDKLDNELRTQQARHTALCDEKLRTEEDLGSSKSAQHRAAIQLDKLQGDIKEMSLQQAELSARLAEETNRKHEAEDELREARRRENETQEELASLTKQLKENHEIHNKGVTELRKEISTLKEREEKTIRELLKRQKREKTELEAELQAMKIELAEDKSSVKSIRRQLERSKSDYDHLHNEFNKLEDENAKVKRNYDRIRMEFEEQAQMAEVDGNRASMLERHRRQLEDRLRQQGMEYEAILRKINREVDVLVQIVSTEKEDRYKAVVTPTKDVTGKPEHWLADIKSKLQWLQEEVQSQLDCQSKVKRSLNRSHSDLQELLKANEVDKIQYEAQLSKQDQTITELKTNREDLTMKNLHKGETVHSLERQVAQLEHHIESNVMALQNSTEQISMQDSFRVNSPDEELDRLKDLQRERDRINERYNRYRGTVSLLQQQLEEARRATRSSRRLGNASNDATDHRRSNNNDGTSPPTKINQRKRRVAFEETTGVSAGTPARKSALNSSYLSRSPHQDIT